ncbi:MAG: PolC-type DNA polymerase III, partial [Bacilli bacterium]
MEKELLKKFISDISLNDSLEVLDAFTFDQVAFRGENELVFSIISTKFLNPSIVDEFIDKSRQFFNDFNLSYEFCIEEEINNDIIIKYFSYYVNKFNFSSPIQNILMNRKLVHIDEVGEVRLEVYNKYEFELVNDSLHSVASILNTLGLEVDFGCIEIEHEMDMESELNEIVKQAYEENKERVVSVDEVQNIVDNNNIIYGKKIGKVTHQISMIEPNMNNVCIEGEVFNVDTFKTKNNKYIITIYVTDYTESIMAKIFLDEKAKELNDITSLKGKYIKIFGHMTFDSFARCDIMRTVSISLEKKREVYDSAKEKRAELHIHTNMSAVDSVIDTSSLISYAESNGYKAIGVVDHNSVQAFPALYNATKDSDLKVIYGVEFNVVDDNLNIIFNNNDSKVLNYDDTYVVFDFETTGLNAYGNDRIVEVGAAKIKNGEIIDTFDKLCNPGVELSEKITEITGIKNSMLIGKPSEEVVLSEFKEWVEDFALVAHNANFDYGFLKSAYKRFNFGEVSNVIIDTLELSRVLNPQWGRHGLAALVKRYKIKLENHHRACDDAVATAHVFKNQLNELKEKELEYVSDINHLVDSDEVYKYGKVSHVTCLVQNNVGLKNLFILVSLACTKYFHKEPRILKSDLVKYHDGLLFGSSCVNGEIFKNAEKLNEVELGQMMEFYDYIEVQPPLVYEHLVQSEEVDSINIIMRNIKKIVNVGFENNKTVIASGDVHHLLKRDKILREIIINNPAPGGGYHKLKSNRINSIPSQHFRTTNEMLSEFDFLSEEVARKIVIENPNNIVASIGEVEVIKDKLFTPKLENSDVKTREMVYSKAKNVYGDKLPDIVEKRIEKELTSIIGHGYDVIYLISSQLVTKSLNDGYLVGSRGSVGSSFVATMMDITEVNPLAPHYICPNCKYSEFIDDEAYACGFDLPKKLCPKCGKVLIGEGHDIPFETFLGFEGDKVPDIDLNFSGEYQSFAHDYTKVLFGEEYVYRAGTISTIAEKTAFGYVKGFESESDRLFSNAEITRLASCCQGVKRGTGQHPGGIIVVPSDMSIFDFTPVQYPADDITSSWKTTHFDFHAIHDNVLKLDILGHDDPTILHMLNHISGIDSKNVEFSREEVISIFSSPASLGISPQEISLKNGNKYILFATGTLGIPEFGTRFVIEMLKDTQPKTFAELVKISGLSHGTDVWLNNGQYLIRNKICEFKDVIGCREDIMVYLLHRGLEPKDAFKIMEYVRKGKGLTEEYIKIMKDNDVPSWYIDSCNKIKYMFPKAHA